MEKRELPYDLWRVDDISEMHLTCLFQPECEFDGTPMKYELCKPFNFEVNDGTGEKNAHALDVFIVCPECGLREMFGVGISKEHYDYIQEWIKGRPKRSYPRWILPEATV